MSDSSLQEKAGSIFLVATPIGNLDDITFRAVECLKAADVIACEDTRHSQRLLQRVGVSGKRLIALHDHNEGARAAHLVQCAKEGESIAFLSDAGMPTVSDPGYRLVQACLEAEIRLEVIPGPSAVTTALAGSGLATDSFYFGGFLPVKGGKREKKIAEALDRAETSIFFESPHRVLKSLAVIADQDADRSVCVARELTKKFESWYRGHARDVIEALNNSSIKGEITLLIAGRGKR